MYERASGLPRLPRWFVSRPRTWSAINTQESPVLLVGPHGCGKTTALLDWALHSERAAGCYVIWCEVGRHARDRFAFWAAIDDSIETAGLTSSGTAIVETVAAGVDQAVTIRKFMRLVTRQDRPLVIVLDNIQELSDEVAADLAAISGISDRLQVLAVFGETHGLPDSYLSHLRLHPPTVVTAAELEFTDNEVRDVITAAGLPPLSDTMRSIEHFARGCPAGTVQLIAEIQRRTLPFQFAGLGPALHPPISVVDGLDIESGIVEFLCRVAFAEAPSIELVMRLDPAANAPELLGVAEERGLGIWSVAEAEPRFIFTGLARAQLRALAGELIPGEIPGLRRTIADWAREHDQIAEFLANVLDGDADDLLLAAHIVTDNFSRLLLARTETLTAMFDRVRPAQLSQCPGLASMAAAVYLSCADQRSRAVVCMAAAVAAHERQPSLTAGSAPAADAVRLARMLVERRRGWVGPGIGITATEQRCAEAEPGPFAADLIIETALRHLADGHRDVALDNLEKVWGSSAPGIDAQRLRAHAYAAAVLSAAGEHPAARAARQRMTLAGWPGHWNGTPSGIALHVADAWQALDHSDYLAAEKHVRMAMTADVDPVEYWIFIAPPLLRIALSGGDAELADAVHRRQAGIDWSNAPHGLVSRRACALAEVALRDDDIDTVEALLLPLAETEGEPAILLARAYLAAGRLVDCKRRLDGAARWGGLTIRLTIEHTLIELAAEQVREDPDPARARMLAMRLSELLAKNTIGFAPGFLPDHHWKAAARAFRKSTGSFLRHSLCEAGKSDPVKPVAPRLTPREVTILQKLATNMTISEIAAENYVSVNTVKSQRYALYRKLGVTSRSDAVRIGRTLGLLTDNFPAADSGTSPARGLDTLTDIRATISSAPVH